MKNEKILIIDFGGFQSQNLAREIRNNSIYCEIYPYKKAMDKIDDTVKGIILSGNKKENIEEYIEKYNNFKLPLLNAIGLDKINNLNDFLGQTKIKNNWNVKNYKDYIIDKIKKEVGNGKVLLALSGGVDSSVCAKLISDAIGHQLTCIFVDTGLMRKNEGEEVRAAFKDSGMELISVNAEERFLEKLAGIVDPEEKRKIIGEEFIRVFEEEGRKIESVDFLAQGTIYSDVIESGDEDEVAIKSHHNVGGLPDVVDFNSLLEPLKYLFKDEVRKLGLEVGLDDNLVWRQPFPGPGLGVRVKGDLTKEKLDMLRDADYIFREEIKNAGLDKSIGQFFAVLTNIQSVGNRDGKRTYDYTVALRAVITTDYMSAEFAEIPYEVLKIVSQRITNEVDGVNRIVYDITSKPPATIEWE